MGFQKMREKLTKLVLKEIPRRKDSGTTLGIIFGATTKKISQVKGNENGKERKREERTGEFGRCNGERENKRREMMLVLPEHEEQEQVESAVSKVRQSTRERRPTGLLSDYVTERNIAYCLLTEDVEPSSFHEATQNADVSMWMTAMHEELEALDINKTWDIVTLPRGRKAIVRVVLALYAVFDLHLEQLDVKTAFLHGNLEEEIYMLQPEGFAENGKENLVGRGYVDSDYAGDPDKREYTTGYVFTVARGEVSWVSKLQIVVALSTMEAEYMTTTQDCKEAILIKRLLEELGHKKKKISLFCDSQSALHIARNPTFHSRTKHIGVQFYFVREVLKEGSVDMQKIHTKNNIADILTKPVSVEKFEWCRSSCVLAET
ncbi:uncharacterized protein [Henckelia pumila]|uniref:uncharacterized protein n=1 Tax=Henckelia pumila TaxID=405737 RepID=UPI003C6E2BA5